MTTNDDRPYSATVTLHLSSSTLELYANAATAAELYALLRFAAGSVADEAQIAPEDVSGVRS